MIPRDLLAVGVAFVAFFAGTGVWLWLMQKVPYRHLWTAYWLGAAIPMGAAVIACVVALEVLP